LLAGLCRRIFAGYKRKIFLEDIIQLLPDHVANQIAAGEVLQRPASAVKELLENSVDAGATQIQLILENAGKDVLQVIDNGKGMSPIDARLCFEKHATSKIKKVDDLFNIHTMGFRGEALASVAAVSKVILKTKQPNATMGTLIEIEDSKVLLQEPTACPTGTNLTIKNLFFNIPARRNFLKSNTTELKNCIEEFIRVALAFPQIAFSLHHNGQLQFQLTEGSLKQRITQLFGNNYNAKLVTVKEDTDYLNIEGFIGKPDLAKKTRGDQYFIVNRRFIKSPYLHHAVMAAFKELIPADSFPFYVLNITLDPKHIDVNVHPTKQEIKFDDDKIVYAFLNAALKHALAQYSVAPALEFDLDSNIQQLAAITNPLNKDQQEIASSGNLQKTFSEKNRAHFIEPNSYTPTSNYNNWRKETFPSLQQNLAQLKEQNTQSNTVAAPIFKQEAPFTEANIDQYKLSQWLNEFIIAEKGTELFIFHQQNIHERIIYERLQKAAIDKPIAAQPSLFPETIHTTPTDAVLLKEVLPLLQQFGYIVEPFGQNSFVVQATPALAYNNSDTENIEQLLEAIKHETVTNSLQIQESLMRNLAKKQAIKAGKKLQASEIKELLLQLWQCNMPHATPTGKKTYHIINQSVWQSIFQ
jgi:DNA mismatch repair protein MutL